MKSVSIGYYRDDGDFAILATLNNKDDDMPQDSFRHLVELTKVSLYALTTGHAQIHALEREDTPDYVTLDGPEPEPVKVSALNAYLQKNVEPITCRDGFTISVQASKRHNCIPATDTGPWTHVECGYPSYKPAFISSYKEGKYLPEDSIYSCVPTDLVERLIESHGGSEQLGNQT